MFGYLIASHVLQTVTRLVQVKQFQKLWIHQKEKSSYKESLENLTDKKEKMEKKERKVRNEFHSAAKMLVAGGEKTMKQ